jgi:hypothetical protein
LNPTPPGAPWSNLNLEPDASRNALKHVGNNHVKFAIGFALWDRIAAERRITLELQLYGFFVTAKNAPEQLIP